MKRTQITQRIKNELSGLPYDMEVWIYGSEARGDAHHDSDIDLLILFNQQEVSHQDEIRIYDVTYPIELDTGVPISLFILPKHQWEARMTPFRDNVLTDRIRL